MDYSPLVNRRILKRIGENIPLLTVTAHTSMASLLPPYSQPQIQIIRRKKKNPHYTSRNLPRLKTTTRLLNLFELIGFPGIQLPVGRLTSFNKLEAAASPQLSAINHLFPSRNPDLSVGKAK